MWNESLSILGDAMFMGHSLWEILVPVQFQCPTYGSLSWYVAADGGGLTAKEWNHMQHHAKWDEHVRQIAGGLTILKPTKKGYWTAENKVHEESMIPVRISCTRQEIEEIAQFTKEHYSQEAIMYYKLSDEVYFV